MFPSIQGKFFFIQYDQWDWFLVFKRLYDRRTVYFVCLYVVSFYFVCFCFPLFRCVHPHLKFQIRTETGLEIVSLTDFASPKVSKIQT